MPASRQKEERMWRRVDQLIRSGKHSGWLSIEWVLREEGYSRARYLLDQEGVRERIDNQCREAQRESDASRT